MKMNKVVVPHVTLNNKGKHICDDCISWCKRIVRDPNEKENKLVFLNEYKEKKLSGKL